MQVVKNLIGSVFITIFVFTTQLTLFADRVELQDGTVLRGQITAISAGQYQLETDFGTLNISPQKINSFKTDKDVYVALKSGSTLRGMLDYKNHRTNIHTGAGLVDISQDEILALWLEGQQNPLLPTLEERKWKYEAVLDISGKTGNSERISTAGSFTATLATQKDQLQLYIHGERAKNNKEISVEELIGGIDYENRFSPPHSWYARAELERDLVEGIDLRATAAVGYGYYFINQEWHELRGRIGFQVRQEDFDDDQTDSETIPALDLGLYWRYDLGDWGRWITDISYYPSLEDADNYRATHQSSLEVPLARSDFWKLRVGAENEYNSEPAPDIKRLDTTYFLRLVLSWQ